MLNYFAISGLCIGFINLSLAVLISKFGKLKVHKVWAFVNYSISLWGFGMFISGSTENHDIAFFGWRIFNVGIILIAVIYYHVIYLFCNLKSKKFLTFSYVQGFIFIGLAVFTNLIFGNKLVFSFNQFYYFRADIFHHFLIFFWTIVVGNAFYELYKYIKKSSGIAKIQGKYLFIAMAFGFGGGLSTAPAAWGLDIYPYGQIVVCIYGLLATYAIFKYQLMDIKVAFSRLGIFIFVYAIVLGIPLLFGYRYGMWQSATWSMLLLATAGPFIYLYLQKKAEEHLLKEDLRVQNFLMKASYGMTAIHDLKKLNKFVLDMMIKTLDLDGAQTFVLDKTALYYEVISSDENKTRFNEDDSCIQFIKKQAAPILYDEIKLRAEADERDMVLKDIYTMMKDASFQVVVPIHTSETLIGFVGLGQRTTNESYSKGMLNALSVFSNQAALAIENCRYIEVESRRMQEEGFQERVASLDMMASSFAHEIDNPMSVVVGQTDFLEEIFNDAQVSMPEQIKQAAYESFDHIVEASRRVSGMIKAILEYSRMGTGELKPVSMNDAAESFMQLIGPKLKTEKVKLEIDIAEDLPFVLGDKIQLEEVLMNFAANAIHAVKNNDEKQLDLRIFQKDGRMIRVEFKDNGYGIPDHLLKDMFLASVTTKGSSEGTGLGLFRVRKIADIHKAEVWAESEGEGKGALMIFEVPVYQGDIHSTIEENHDKPLDGPNAMF